MSILILFTCDTFCDKEEDHFYVIVFALGEDKTLLKDFFQQHYWFTHILCIST